MLYKKPKFWDNKNISLLSIVLYPFSLIYRLIFFIFKIFKTHKQFKISTVCIGNIYIGGTGKTPLAREIFKIIKSLNKNPAFIKKSYNFLDDEIQMLKKTGKTFSSLDRSKSIYSAINQGYDVAILDDGFQDYSIKPDFSILCFNSRQLIGNGFTIPSGPLREGLSSIKNAHCVVINGDRNIDFEKKIKNLNPKIKIFNSKYRIKNLKKINHKKVIAFAGIGNPKNFFDILENNNINITKTFSFPDHYNYTDNDLNKFIEKKTNTIFLTTEKDYFRLSKKMKKKCYSVKVELEIKRIDNFKKVLKRYI